MVDASGPPPAAALLLGFVNTRDVERGSDALSTPEALGDWLRGNDLLTGAATVSEEDRLLAVSCREALRTALLAHHDVDVDPAFPDLERVARDLPLRLVFPPGGPSLEPTESGVRGALTALVAEVHRSLAEGSWHRLKACPGQDCTWAFYDSSRNRSRTWCSMRVCGNRSKTATFRARHASD